MYENYSEFLIKRLKEIFGKDFEKALASYEKNVRRAIRINTCKISTDDCINRLRKKGYAFSRVPWCNHSFFVEKEPASLSATVEYLSGYFLIQDPTSTVPVLELSPKKHEIILDMTASPGAKTTHISQLMQDTGAVVASEIDQTRVKTILHNVSRMGFENVITIRTDARKIDELGIMFDKILLDAPCTADGTISKNERLRKEIKPEDYIVYPEKQKELLTAAKSVLKKGGTIVYATCSTAPEENEMVVEYAVEKLGLRLLKPSLQKHFSEGKTNFFGKKHPDYLKNCIRILPHKYNTQAFFVAKLQG